MKTTSKSNPTGVSRPFGSADLRLRCQPIVTQVTFSRQDGEMFGWKMRRWNLWVRASNDFTGPASFPIGECLCVDQASLHTSARENAFELLCGRTKGHTRLRPAEHERLPKAAGTDEMDVAV